MTLKIGRPAMCARSPFKTPLSLTFNIEVEASVATSVRNSVLHHTSERKQLSQYFRRKINKLNKLLLPQFPRAGNAVQSWRSAFCNIIIESISNAKEEKATETNTSFIDGGEIASAYLHSPRARVTKLLPLNYNKAMDMYMMIKAL
ncbi:hypothetical protein AVEN_154783-1 [Araneus ventricosus]|uniref:Uncharacterized protein n=1 Tax=Araneus ventricosus TaxID=182803 RepID=A0A4Y2BTV8_ARAVE|nr:hypothetical protein AVEN_154783-1 [Araneus ventricosus]